MENDWMTVRNGCGLLPSPGQRSVLRLVGEDRVIFLQGMLSNDVASLAPGQGIYAALLTQQGKLVSDLRVYLLEDEVWLDTPAARAPAVRAALERFIIADDVTFADASGHQPLLSLEGPHSVRVALALFGEALDGLHLYSHQLCSFEKQPLRVVAASETGESGLLVIGPATLRDSLQTKACAAGAQPVDAPTLDVLRVEAGIPWFDRDMDESTLISEAGLSGAISFTKGCYLGQEVVERVAARGQVQKRLAGLVCDGELVPPPDTKLLAGDQEVGWITSAVRSPALSSIIALGYVRREHWEVGNTLQIAGGAAARVTALPFVRRHDVA